MPTASPVPVPTPAEIDEFGSLDREIKLRENRRDFLKTDVITPYLNTLDPNKPQDLRGLRYVIQATPNTNERTVVSPAKLIAALKKAIGMAALMAELKVLLATVDKYIPKSQQKAFVVEERTGSRRLTVVGLADPEIQKKAA